MVERSAILSNPVVAGLKDSLSRLAVRDALVGTEVRPAAVAALLRMRTELELLFIRRAELAGDPWSGHMAFPGGRWEASDDSLEATAFRETREELGVTLDHSLLLGRLDDIAPGNSRLPPIVVRPFVVAVASDVRISMNEEVAAALWVPVPSLLDPSSRTEYILRSGDTTRRYPGYDVGGQTVWGMTHRIVTQLLGILSGTGV